MRAEPILTSVKTVRIRDHGVPNPQGLETVSVYLGCQRLLRSDAGRQLTPGFADWTGTPIPELPMACPLRCSTDSSPSNSLSGLNTS